MMTESEAKVFLIGAGGILFIWMLTLATHACSTAPAEPKPHSVAAPAPAEQALDIPGPPGRVELPAGQPGDLADRVCRHLESIGCHQRVTCAGSVRLRQRDKLHEMREDEALAAKTVEDVRKVGTFVCLP